MILIDSLRRFIFGWKPGDFSGILGRPRPEEYAVLVVREYTRHIRESKQLWETILSSYYEKYSNDVKAFRHDNH